MDIAALCLFAFLAGIVDAVAGGGGLIQVPALFAIFPSVPAAALLGTNKLSSVAGTATAALRYGRSVPINWRSVLPAAFVAGLGAVVGAKTVTMVDPVLLRPCLVLMLSGMAGYTIARPDLGTKAGRASFRYGSVSFFSIAGAIGFYDGFFGPGAGSIMMFLLVKLFGHDFLSAAATTKVLNLATNFGALVLFAMTGNVLYAVALPMAACNVAGSWVGAHLAIKKGARFVRTVFVVVVAALIGKVLLDLISGQ